MRNTIGFLLQFAALVFLPMVIIWQLDFGFQLIRMPACTLAAIAVFWLGSSMRDKAE